jgi:hypothetical protein
LPGLLGHGGGGGWGGGSLLDSLLPHAAQIFPGILDHFQGSGGYNSGAAGGGGGGGWDGDSGQHGSSRPFGYQDYYEYNGVHNHNRMGKSHIQNINISQ